MSDPSLRGRGREPAAQHAVQGHMALLRCLHAGTGPAIIYLAPVSGQYPVWPPGGQTGREVTSVQGRPLPPTSRPGETYGKPDVTKHKK